MNFKNKLKKRIDNFFNPDKILHLSLNVIELNNINELKKLFNWKEIPIIDDPKIYEVNNIEDLNERRLKDAETIGNIICNLKPKVALEIGTAEGHSTALMAKNSPDSIIYTVNILPEHIINNQGGILTTKIFNIDEIGSYYKKENLSNIKQIYADTKNWQPDIGPIDFSFIDGCHDTDYIINDTKKALKFSRKGSFILWHDFNIDLIKKYNWIKSVCLGIEKLYEINYLKGRIFHVKDSWIGVYIVPED